ncbi:glycosyltransferase [Pararhizobium sp.]|uniref:glycosyltransferase n=1 Tax=Pararhizobium sp. TaxID=1977563 RepID=UPI003D0DCA48
MDVITSRSSAGLLKTAYREISNRLEKLKRAQLRLLLHDRPSAAPRILFLTPDYNVPSGGIRVIYRHVDILNDAGISAFVLHQRAGFRCTWFENTTSITNMGNAQINRSDLLVVPELDVDVLGRLSPGIKYAIFNQNSHLTWKRASSVELSRYMANDDLSGIVTVSSHNQEMLEYSFPNAAVQRVHLGIDPAIFFAGSGNRPRSIGYMPRRGREDARQVFEMLQARGCLRGWQVTALDGLSHGAVADRLRSTRIFLAFTNQEGFGLPAAEAMACGNYVIGNHGNGGREFFHNDFSCSIDHGDTLAFAKAVEQAIIADREDDDWCTQRGRAASEFILSKYTPEQEKTDVLTLYTKLLRNGGDSKKSAAPIQTEWAST